MSKCLFFYIYIYKYTTIHDFYDFDIATKIQNGCQRLWNKHNWVHNRLTKSCKMSKSSFPKYGYQTRATILNFNNFNIVAWIQNGRQKHKWHMWIDAFNENVVNYYFLFRRYYLIHLFIWKPSYFVVHRRHHYLFWKSPFLLRKARVRRLPIWSPSTYPLIPPIQDAKKHFHVIIHTLSPVCSGSVVVTAYAARVRILGGANIL